MTLVLKNLLFTVLVPGSVGVYLPWLIAPGRFPASGPAFALAIPLLVMGGAIYGWCVWDFAVFGRGTPAPADAPKRLVVRGLYRFVRNPMYLGVLTLIAGWAIGFRSATLALYGIIVALGFHLMVVLHEEPHLEEEFGQDYREYRARVGRWLPRRPAPDRGVHREVR